MFFFLEFSCTHINLDKEMFYLICVLKEDSRGKALRPHLELRPYKQPKQVLDSTPVPTSTPHSQIFLCVRGTQFMPLGVLDE